MAEIQFSLIKKLKIGRPEHLIAPTPLRPITSHFCLTLGFIPCKAKEALRNMELQQKE